MTLAHVVYGSIEELLDASRVDLRRVLPEQTPSEVEDGALLVDIRPAWQRVAEGEIPGSLIVERNHLEWRLHPDSTARLPQAVAGQRWIVICSQGYSSSLAAASLRSIGIDATDLAGGVQAWRAAGLPLTAGLTAAESVVGSPGSEDLGDLGRPHVEHEAAH